MAMPIVVPHKREFRGADLRMYYSLFPVRNPLSREQETELVKSAKSGDSQAEGKLIRQWGRRVIDLALRQSKRRPEGIDLEDLIGWGLLGLLLGIRAFDPTRGTRLSTCINYWIKEYIQKGCRSQRFIHLPVDSTQIWYTLLIAADKQGINLSTATPESWAELSSVLMENPASSRHLPTPDYLQEVFRLAQASRTFHLEAVPSEDFIRSGDSPTPFDAFAAPPLSTFTEAQEHLQIALCGLNTRERAIICHRFGLGSHDLMTLTELGDLYNLTKERIRQIEEKALKKLHLDLKKRLRL
jgi:RNA polymerase sigma factor (sigma-70 family)